MQNTRWKSASITTVCGLVLAASMSISPGNTNFAALAMDGDEAQKALELTEKDYRDGKVDAAIQQANTMLLMREKGTLTSEQIAIDAQLDLAVFQFKAGHADESAKIIRSLLMQFQLASPMAPGFSQDPAKVYASTPQELKNYFAKTVERLKESADTKAILDSLVDNTVPKDYAAKLREYCKKEKAAIDLWTPIKSVADGEELKYGDPLSSLSEDSPDKNDPKISKSNLEKLDKTLDDLATQAQQMPVGDAIPALAIYNLALAANCAHNYEQGETFARQALSHMNALSDDLAGRGQVKVALAYALMRQNKKDEFSKVLDELLEKAANQERLLITIARFFEASGDTNGAMSTYDMAIKMRKERGETQKPEWQGSYDALAEKIKKR